MNGPEIQFEVAPELRPFVSPDRRRGRSTVLTDGSSTLGHVVESLGIPLTEAGEILVDGRPVSVSHIPGAGETVRVRAVKRPQRVPGAPLRFLLDVHLGTLARRLRLLGVDAAYESEDIGDAALAARSADERRVLLSRDRGLLHRREIWAGAYVYSDRPEDQLRDVLERFAPRLAPWTRCTACNGPLKQADKDSVSDLLEHGTRRSYDVFAQCAECDRVYWRGAHHSHLDAIVAKALRDFAPSGPDDDPQDDAGPDGEEDRRTVPGEDDWRTVPGDDDRKTVPGDDAGQGECDAPATPSEVSGTPGATG